jgi:dihydroneopterin aldolase
MGILQINGINCYAYHGCLPEEAVIGGNYIVNVCIEGDFLLAETTDELSNTADYVEVCQLVKQEMSIRSKLIEHVALRIKQKLMARYPLFTIKVEVIKLKPPVNGDVERVSYSI